MKVESAATHSDKAGREPGFLVLAPAPPPVLVRGFQNLDDVSCLEAQLLVIHGHVVPQGFRAHHTAIADQLEGRRWVLSAEARWAEQGGGLCAVSGSDAHLLVLVCVRQWLWSVLPDRHTEGQRKTRKGKESW